MLELADRLFASVRMVWRYRWYAMVVAWTIALGGWVAIHFVPDRYEARARVYVDTQSVLRPLLQGLAVQPNVEQVVTMMGRTLLSRPNLERVIGMTGLDTKLETPRDRERLLDRLFNTITVRSAGGENLYTIAYAEKNPEEAKRVVQSLLSLFMEQSIGDKRKDSEQALRFIDEQLKIYSERLTAAESAMTDFRRRNLGLMAGNRQDYYARLVEAQSDLNQATLHLKEAEDSRTAIKRQLQFADEQVPSLLGDTSTSAEEGTHFEIDARIQTLEQKLDGLRLNYTEQHPDVVAAVRIIDQLKEQKKAELKQKKAELKRRKPSASPVQTQDPVHQQLSVALASAEANVAAMNARVEEYRRRFDKLKAAADAVPQVDAEFTQLTRDYEVTKKNYENLLARRETAQISGDMERQARVMVFRVIDPPQVPSVPSWPNRMLLASLVLLAALGGGIGVAVLISQIRPTFSDEHRLRELSGLQVLGTVAMAWTNAQKLRRRWGLLAFVMSFAGLLSIYAVMMATLVLTASKV